MAFQFWPPITHGPENLEQIGPSGGGLEDLFRYAHQMSILSARRPSGCPLSIPEWRVSRTNPGTALLSANDSPARRWGLSLWSGSQSTACRRFIILTVNRMGVDDSRHAH